MLITTKAYVHRGTFNLEEESEIGCWRLEKTASKRKCWAALRRLTTLTLTRLRLADADKSRDSRS